MNTESKTTNPLPAGHPTPTTIERHEPPHHLLDDLQTDDLNRFKRLLVADWVLNGPEPALDMRSALDLYDGSGRPGLLDAPGRLTVASIYAEVLWMLDAKK